MLPEKFFACTDTTGSIGWPSPVPRLHIDDCFRDAGCSVGVTVSCDEDVGEAGEDEVEELADRPRTTKGT